MPEPVTPTRKPPSRARAREGKLASGVFEYTGQKRAGVLPRKSLKLRLVAELAATESASGVRYYGSDLYHRRTTEIRVEVARNYSTTPSGSRQGAGGVGGLIAFRDATASKTYSPFSDGNGNVMGWVNNANGVVEASFDYDPFGNVTSSAGVAATASPFRFSTKYSEAETGLLYYGFRFYNPATGRWLSRDPFEERGGVNLYGFCFNNAVGNFDTDGRFVGTVGSGVSAETALANAGISSGVAWGAPVAEVGLGTTVGAGAVALPVGYAAGTGWDQIPELWGGPRISDFYGDVGISIMNMLPTEQNRETRQWREFDELQRLRQEYAKRKYGTDRALDDCLDKCEKDICPTDPDREAKLKACYCACWKKYPSNKREKTREELIEEWKKLNQKPWPRGATPHHILPLADGGLDGGANIYPLDPTNHKGYHKEQQDANRWGKRSRRGCDQ